jgi:prolipoprotein diacylglyceryltransferase
MLAGFGGYRLTIVVSTNSNLHLVFDAAAWISGISSGLIVPRLGLQPPTPSNTYSTAYLVCLAVGAIMGAYFTGSLPALIRGEQSVGHSVAGALAGAIAGVELYKLVRGERRSTGGAFVVPFTVGIIVGRWGCLFAGLTDDTYGTPSKLPWAVDLGDHIPRHPVEIYESLAMLVFLGAYLFGLQRRQRWAVENGFHAMVIWYGLQRFCWEFLKPYPTVLGPLNSFHFLCLGLVVYGFIWIARARRSVSVTA